MTGQSKIKKQEGFTLIELLIVIAIIGILAAIAIPNFLNAQTRAKVARAKTDIKTLVTGLEQYCIDHGNYPTYHYTGWWNFYIGGTVTGRHQSPAFIGANPLTSPIAYISSYPDDPFAAKIKKETPEDHQFHYVSWPYAIATAAERDVDSFQKLYLECGDYRVHSRGPDTKGPDSGLPYDPTNGVTSAGDIIYSQKSGFSDEDFTAELPPDTI